MLRRRTARRLRRQTLGGAVAAVCLLASAHPIRADRIGVRAPAQGGALPGPLPLFPATNWWNLDITDAPVDPRSDAFIAFINNGSRRRLRPDFGGDAGGNEIYGFPYATVDGNQPKRAVTFLYSDESDGVDHTTDQSIPFYPIPDEAITQPRWIEGGDPGNVPRPDQDRHMLIVDRDNRRLYELYALFWNGSGWEAGSGAAFDLDSDARRPDGWTSADAAGLAILPGLVRYDEVYEADEIRHAFRVTVRATNGYVYPASHRAGSNSQALPMGARLRLKASKDLSPFPREIQRIFRALQRYGLIVADNGSDMFVSGTYDRRWNNDILNPAFAALTASDFDVIELGYRGPEPAPPSDIVDVNGDGRADVFAYDAATGAWSQHLGDRSGSFAAVRSGAWSAGWRVWPADFNGDRVTDFFLFDATTGRWFKAIGNGTGDFTYFGSTWSPIDWRITILDLNGDRRSDALLYDVNTGMWFRCTSLGAGTGDFAYVSGTWDRGWTTHRADWNGDGLADLFLYNPATGSWTRATGTTSGDFAYASGLWSPGWEILAGDFTRRGRSDLFLYNRATGGWFVASPSGDAFTYRSGGWSPGWSIRVADLDGDRVSDAFLYQPDTGVWFEAFGTGTGDFTYVSGSWSAGWQISPVDFSGDGRADLFLYNPTTGAWFQAISATRGSLSYGTGVWSPGLTVIASR